MINTEKRSARFGAAILLFSLLLRLFGGAAMPQAQAEGFSPHRPVGGISVGTGPSQPTQTVPTIPTLLPVGPTVPTVPPQPTLPPLPPQPPGITFFATDLDYVKFRYATDCSYRTELEPLLLQPLRWQLDDGQPTVLIVHSHATESFTKEPGQTYKESSDYRTENPDYNMVAVGDALAALLRDRGIAVVHDRQLHDSPSYSASYTNSRKSVEEYLAEYPSIKIVLDLHRDAALNADGTQYATSATVNGEKSAQLMLLAGSDSYSGYHPGWKENLSLALKLQVLLEKGCPGITRRTVLRGGVFNQDLCSGMLIVEVGAAGNTLTEAMRAMLPLADAIAALKNGANCEG